MDIEPPTMGDLEDAHSVLEDFFADHEEPMSAWAEADRAKLEMCCRCTEVSAFGVAKYQSLEEKAAKLFYSAIKLHIFPNGNKRFGLVVLLAFLLKHDVQMNAAEGEPTGKAVFVAASDPHVAGQRPDEVIADLTKWIVDKTGPFKY